MIRIRRKYFDTFRCIAADCPDSCCHEWDVQVDEASAAYYRALPGALGDRLRQVLRTQDGETVIAIEDGRCPMWRTDGLCRIQAELGEKALCDVCREFPRLKHDYGDFIELGLELSCPEAARILLSQPDTTVLQEEIPGENEPEYDTEAMTCLLHSRETAFSILADTRFPPKQALVQLLLYGYQAQAELDGEPESAFDAAAALESAAPLAGQPDWEAFWAFFRELEILTEQWPRLLCAAVPGKLPDQTRLLARYLVERYWLQAVSDYDLVCRVKFIIICCLLVGSLGGSYIPAAQLFSKEIENDADNVDAILDGAYTCPAFTDDRLLGMLLSEI